MDSHLETKRKAIAHLEKKNFFENNVLYKKILYYLIDAEEKGEQPKSTTIGIDLLGEEQLNTSMTLDSYIRAQIHGIRKKLELYYLSEGKQDEYKIIIPKGKYAITLETNDTPEKKKTAFERYAYLMPWILGLLFIAIVSNIILIIAFKKNKTTETVAKPSELLGHTQMLLQGTKAFTLVIEDSKLLREYDEEQRIFRHILVNNDLSSEKNSVRTYQRKYPERRTTVSRKAFIDPFLIEYAQNLKFNAIKSHNTIALKYSSDVKTITSDIVFFGNSKTNNLGVLKPYFYNSNFRSKADAKNGSNIILLVNKSDTTAYHWEHSNETTKRNTYFIIFKTMSINGHQLVFLLNNDSVSKSYVLNEKNFPIIIDELSKKVNLQSKSFEALIKINGRGSIGMTHEIIYAQTVE